MKKITIQTDYIKLGQLIKFLGLVDTGGEVPGFIYASEILVDSAAENRRGRKIYPGMKISIDGEEYEICS